MRSQRCPTFHLYNSQTQKPSILYTTSGPPLLSRVRQPVGPAPIRPKSLSSLSIPNNLLLRQSILATPIGRAGPTPEAVMAVFIPEDLFHMQGRHRAEDLLWVHELLVLEQFAQLGRICPVWHGELVLVVVLGVGRDLGEFDCLAVLVAGRGLRRCGDGADRRFVWPCAVGVLREWNFGGGELRHVHRVRGLAVVNVMLVHGGRFKEGGGDVRESLVGGGGGVAVCEDGLIGSVFADAGLANWWGHGLSGVWHLGAFVIGPSSFCIILFERWTLPGCLSMRLLFGGFGLEHAFRRASGVHWRCVDRSCEVLLNFAGLLKELACP